MYFKYGDYQHDNNEVNLASIEITPERSEGGLKHRVRETWTIEGELFSSSATALTAELATLEGAYGIDGRTAALYEDNGTLTRHILGGTGSLGGCRILGFRYPRGDRDQYVTSRAYSITLEATTIVTSSGLVFFSERVSFQGGGLEYVWRKPIGPRSRPIRQPLRQGTFKATQSGQAVGQLRYPVAMAPLWPAALILQSKVIEQESPRRFGPAGRPYYTEFPVSWSYAFESDSPLVGLPNRWIG